MKILNLACGTKTSEDHSVVNIDWSIMDRIRINPFLRALAPILLSGDRLKRFLSLPENIMLAVIREAYGSSQQRPVRRFIENLLLVDARSCGETHQWIYDRFNLAALLQSCGFSLFMVDYYA